MSTIAWIDHNIDVIGESMWRVEVSGNRVLPVSSVAAAESCRQQIADADVIVFELFTSAEDRPDFPVLDFLGGLQRGGRKSPPLVMFSSAIEEIGPYRRNGPAIQEILRKPATPAKLQQVINRVLAASIQRGPK